MLSGGFALSYYVFLYRMQNNIVLVKLWSFQPDNENDCGLQLKGGGRGLYICVCVQWSYCRDVWKLKEKSEFASILCNNFKWLLVQVLSFRTALKVLHINIELPVTVDCLLCKILFWVETYAYCLFNSSTKTIITSLCDNKKVIFKFVLWFI